MCQYCLYVVMTTFHCVVEGIVILFRVYIDTLKMYLVHGVAIKGVQIWNACKLNCIMCVYKL